MRVADLTGEDWPEGYGRAAAPPTNVVPFRDENPPTWMDEAPLVGEPIQQPAPIVATPFEWRAEVEIPRRMWLYGKHLLLAPPEKAAWYRMNNVALGNSDQVGVACPWRWPELFEGISTAHLIASQKAVSAGEWRADSRSSEWVGIAIARVLGLEPEKCRKRIADVLKEWIKNGAFKVVEREDEYRHTKKFVEVDKWATE
jgi:hypothetical protein